MVLTKRIITDLFFIQDQIIFHSDSNTCFIDGQLTDFNEEQALISSQEAFQSWKNHNNRISILKK